MARILITDDEAPMRALLTAVLTGMGHTPVEAAGAREALRLHEAAPADLIVTDLVMKDMDGIELLRRVREQSPDVPVVAISGHRHSKIWLNMAKLIGAQRILAKPFSAEEFTACIAEVLAIGGPRGAVTIPPAESDTTSPF